MNKQILQVFTLIIVAQSVLINLNATPPIRELDNPEKRKYILELAGQVSQANGKQLLESYSTWELGTLLQDMQKLALQEHAYAAERQAQATDSGNRTQINDTNKFFERALLRNLDLKNPFEKILSSKISFITDSSAWKQKISQAWTLELSKEINDKLAEVQAEKTQDISNQLCTIFTQSAGQAFTEEEQKPLRRAIKTKIDEMVGERDYQKAEAEKWPILDNTADIKALDTTITYIKELRHKRFISLFKKFCCICIAVGLYRYRNQIAHYLLTHNFTQKVLARAHV